jgi:ribosomal protein S18 acetylase RimI-like enzyme
MSDAAVLLQWNPRLDDDTAHAIVDLINSTVEDGGLLGHIEPMSPATAGQFISNLSRRIDEQDVHLLLGRMPAHAGPGQPVLMALMTQSTMPNCRHTAELTKGVVHPRWRGQRLVDMALRALVDRATDLGVEQFTLDVREGSRAHRLWQRFGFVSYGVLDDYARVQGQRFRGHFMAQPVDVLRTRLATAAGRADIRWAREASHA